MKSVAENVVEPSSAADAVHVDLLNQVKYLGEGMLKCAPKMFENVISQIKVLKLGLEFNIEGVHFLKSVKDGKLFTPEGFEEDGADDDEDGQKDEQAE